MSVIRPARRIAQAGLIAAWAVAPAAAQQPTPPAALQVPPAVFAAQPIDAVGGIDAAAAAAPALQGKDIESLLARLEALERAQEARVAEAAISPEPPKLAEAAKPAKDAVPADKWSVKLGGHVQMDHVLWAAADASIPDARNYFEFRRLRLMADGVGYEVYDFRLQMTLEPETVGESPAGTVTSPDVKDAYLSVNEIPLLGRIRFGNFFVPFGLEQVTNDTFNVFLERSIPTQGIFTADREVGVAVYNATEDRRVTWASGLFFDSISEGLKERIDDNQGYRMSGRLTFLPYYDDCSDGRRLLHVGVGALRTGDQDDRIRFRARPQIHEGPRLIDSGVIAADGYTTGNLETAVVWESLAVQAETFLAGLDGDAGEASGSYVHASYFVTGENRVFERFGQHGAQFGRTVPARRFRVTRCGTCPGALELKARWSHLDLSAFGRGQYNDLTAGFNWYWTDRTRVMFDWVHPFTSSDTVVGAAEADILASRLDFNW